MRKYCKICGSPFDITPEQYDRESVLANICDGCEESLIEELWDAGVLDDVVADYVADREPPINEGYL